MSIWSRRRGEEGFTLIELAVAIGLFGLVLMSLSLLFDRALETTRRVQSDQVGKTLAQEKLEEVRSLPFFVSRKQNPNPVDLLDRYFPGTVAISVPNHPAGPTVTGAYNGTAGVYAYSSTDTLVRAGVTYTRAATVQLVAINADSTLSIQAPVAGYDSTLPDQDDPGPRAAKVAVTVSFVSQGQPRSVTLQTIVANTKNEQPKVEASASVTGAQISGVTFQDGDVAGAVAADILAQLGLADLNFREVTGPSAQASADPVEVTERRPDNNDPLQSGPTAGAVAATAPNSTTGNAQVVPSPATPLTAGNMLTVNPSPLSKVVIAAWGEPNPQASAEARVSFQHAQNPESRAQVAADDFLLNARNPLELAPHAVIQIGEVDGTVEQTSTITNAHARATGVIRAVTIWASTSFGSNPDYEGTVLIDAISVEVESDASTTAATTHVHWRVDNLRVWDPDLGAYVGPWTFGFDHDCGGWVGTQPNPGDPECGNFVNPNPVVIPVAYQGIGPDGQPGTSLVIVAGATVQDAQADAAQGVSSASAGQQNVLSISTRDDIAGAVDLEPMLAGIGAADSSVSYVSHSH